MRKIIILLMILLSFKSNAQLKFGARSGLGVYFDVYNLNLLAPKYDKSLLSSPKLSYYGNPLPRGNDASNHKVYTDFGLSQEIFAKWRKNEVSFSYTYIKEPRPYEDMAELFWGENEDHRDIYYQLVFSRTYLQKKNWSLQAGLGIAVNYFIVSRATYESYQDSNTGEVYVGAINFDTVGEEPGQYDQGFPLKLQFNYNISKNAALGLQSSFIYLMGLGITHLNLTPTLQISL